MGYARSTGPMVCKDAREASALASNAAYVLGLPSDTYSEECWILRHPERDTLHIETATHFVRIARFYRSENK